MFARFELSAAEAIGAMRGYRETKGDRASPKISDVRRIIGAAANRKKNDNAPAGGNKKPALGYTIEDRASPGRGYPFWFPRADQAPEGPELERHAFRTLERIEQVYGGQWAVVWPDREDIEVDAIPF